MQSKKFFWFLIILAMLIAIGVLVLTYIHTKAPGPAANANTQSQPKVVKRDIDPSKLPDQFPTDLPLEAGATVQQNYTSTTSDGKFQSTRVIATTKTLDQNYKIFNDYFTKNGYKIEATLNQPTIKAIAATKGNIQVSATFNQSGDGKSRTIDLTVTQSPPSASPAVKK